MRIAVSDALQGRPVLWAAPTDKQLMVGWNETLNIRGIRNYAQFKVSKKEVEFVGGGRIIYRSMDDPNTARGATASKVVIDESGEVKEEAYYEVLRPMVADTGGDIWGIGTPKGAGHWFWREHVKARYNPLTTAAWQIPTRGAEIREGVLYQKPHPLENPAFPWAEMLELYRSMPERSFRQEILAEFIQSGGAVFRDVDAVVRRHEHGAGEPCYVECAGRFPKEPYNGTFVAGLDWGRESDFTDMTVLDAATGDEVDHDRFNQVGWDIQRARVLAMHRKWNITSWLVEKNAAGGPNVEALQRDGLPVIAFTTTQATKASAVEALVLSMEQKRIWLGDIPENDELKAYEQQTLPSGTFRYTGPSGLHDDRVMSLMLANLAIQQEPIPFEGSIY
jgi:hypothetical protein